MTDDVFRALVVGEPGTGKTSLVSVMQTGRKQLRIGMDPNGVTKTVDYYQFDLAKQGRMRDIIIDGPGTGDMDVPLSKYIANLEAVLRGVKMNAVLICETIAEPRIRMGLQVVIALIQKGFIDANVGQDGGDTEMKEATASGGPVDNVWDHILLVGTKKDRAEPHEEANFRGQYREYVQKTLGVPEGLSIPVCLIGNCKSGCEPDVDELYEAMRRVPRTEIAYRAPTAQDLAAAMGQLAGVEMKDQKEFEEAMKMEREAHEQLIKEYHHQMEKYSNKIQEVEQRMDAERVESEHRAALHNQQMEAYEREMLMQRQVHENEVKANREMHREQMKVQENQMRANKEMYRDQMKKHENEIKANKEMHMAQLVVQENQMKADKEMHMAQLVATKEMYRDQMKASNEMHKAQMQALKDRPPQAIHHHHRRPGCSLQ